MNGNGSAGSSQSCLALGCSASECLMELLALCCLSSAFFSPMGRAVPQQVGLSPAHLQDSKSNTYSVLSNPPTLS